MSSLRIPVLAYHSHHIGDTYEESDRVALARDLRTIDALGFRVIPLSWVVEWVLGRRRDSDLHHGVAITFDDGADFDFRDLEHPIHGPQASMYRVLCEFAEEMRARQPHVEGTSFVIGSPAVRMSLDRSGLHGKGWVSDWWWKEANASGVLKIANHSWDHNHVSAATVCQRNQEKGTFENIETFEECECEIAGAARFIANMTGGHWPTIFGYPYGESSQYVRDEYFPRFVETHGTVAAFGGTGGYVTEASSRWNIERWVCTNRSIGWQTPDEFVALLEGAR